MKLEERFEIGLSSRVETSDIECEPADQNEKDDDEYISDRCREVGAQFAFEYRPETFHVRWISPPETAAVVMERNTSSRRPFST